MKIGFVTHEGVIFSKGGPYTKIKEVSEILKKKGFTVDLFNPWNHSLDKYDLIHLVSSNFAVYNIARIMNVNKIKFIVEPVFFSTHSSSFLSLVNNTDRLVRKVSRGIWLDYGFTRDICNWAVKVTPNTSDELKLISRGLSIPEEKFRIIHNGVSDKFLHADPSLFEKKYGYKDYILCVGHIGPARKNILSFVRSLKTINHPAVFIGKIIPSAESEKVLEEAHQNKNLKIIEALDNQSEMLASAYAGCSTFVLPSLYETPGIAALEAGLAGAKIVITPFGGTKDYFSRRDGFPNDMAEYVNPYSVDDIKNGIEKTLNKPKNDMLKEHIKQNFLWDKIADDTINLYNELLS